jgi:hypothetical protein
MIGIDMDEQEQVEDYPSTGATGLDVPVNALTELGPHAALDELAWSATDEATELVSYRGHSVSAALVALVCIIATAVAVLVSTLLDSGTQTGTTATAAETIPASQLPAIQQDSAEPAPRPLAVSDTVAQHMIDPEPDPTPTDDRDERFFRLLQHDGVIVTDPAQAVAGAHKVCAVLARSDEPTLHEVINWMAQDSGVSHDVALSYVIAANVVYCPWIDRP